MLSFQRLDVCRCATELLSLAAAIEFPRGLSRLCAAIMDSLYVLKVLDEARREHAIELLSRIVAMLTKLCR